MAREHTAAPKTRTLTTGTSGQQTEDIRSVDTPPEQLVDVSKEEKDPATKVVAKAADQSEEDVATRGDPIGKGDAIRKLHD